MNPAHMNVRVVMSSQMSASSKSTWVQVGGRFETCPQSILIRATTRWWEGHRSAMNPAQINAGVVMPSQMFGIVEIHVGAGLGQV